MPRLVVESDSDSDSLALADPAGARHGTDSDSDESGVPGTEEQEDDDGSFDQEQDADTFEEESEEKVFSPPDNRPRPTTLSDITPERVLNVPYADRTTAKELGAWWAPQIKRWYVPKGYSTSPFNAWRAKGKARVKGKENSSDQPNSSRAHASQSRYELAHCLPARPSDHIRCAIDSCLHVAGRSTRRSPPARSRGARSRWRIFAASSLSVGACQPLRDSSRHRTTQDVGS